MNYDRLHQILDILIMLPFICPPFLTYAFLCRKVKLYYIFQSLSFFSIICTILHSPT